MNVAAYCFAALLHNRCEVYLLLRIGLPDAFLWRRRPPFCPG